MLIIGTRELVSTAVVVVNTNRTIDCENLFWHIIPNEIFLGVKYNCHYKGQAYSDVKKRTGSFFNQITIILYIEKLDKIVNVKMFTNGKCQISGVKTVEQAVLTIEVLFDFIVNIKGINRVSVIKIDGVYYNKKEWNNFMNKVHSRFDCIKFYDVFSDKPIQIGERKGKDIFIYGSSDTRIPVEIYDRLDCFIEKTVERLSNKAVKKRLFSKTTGYCIGHAEYHFTYKKKIIDFRKYKFIFHELTDSVSVYKMINEFDAEVGLEYITVVSVSVATDATTAEIDTDVESTIHVNYTCVKPCTIPTEIAAVMSNMNANFRLTGPEGQEISILREVLHNIFIEKYNFNSTCMLDNSYPAVKLKLYYTKDYVIIPFSEIAKNIPCYTNSMSIFGNGQVLTFGSLSLLQLTTVKRDLIKILNDNVMKILKAPKPVVDIIDHDITIWDIM